MGAHKQFSSCYGFFSTGACYFIMSNNCVISVCAVQNDAIFNATAKGNLHCFGVALWRQPQFESLTLNVVFVNKLWDFSFLLRVVKLTLIVAKT